MHDGSLPSGVKKSRMIAHVYHIEHDRARTKVERNIIPHGRPWKDVDWTMKPCLFQTGHANGRSGMAVSLYERIAMEPVRRNDAGETIHMHDVVRLGVRRY